MNGESDTVKSRGIQAKSPFGKTPKLLKDKHVYQISDHLGVALIAFFTVLFRVAIHISCDHMITVALGGETHDVNTDARPTTMEEKGIVLPINEPFVLHFLRHESHAD